MMSEMATRHDVFKYNYKSEQLRTAVTEVKTWTDSKVSN